MLRTRVCKAKIVAVISSMLLCQEAGYSKSEPAAHDFSVVHTELGSAEEDIDRCSDNREARPNAACSEDNVSAELLAMGERGDRIARARRQALEILEAGNACAAWFQESDPDASQVFRSLHYELDRQGTSHIEMVRGALGVTSFKHPWGARSTESSGSNSIISLNANGPFFFQQSQVTDSAGGIRPAWHWLKIGFYDGDTMEARVTILLHELGHIIGRLPEDKDSWNGQSSRNTMEVLQHCKSQIDRTARKNSHIHN
jgi:hypothetical protein